jgi:hypothetical protein
VAWGGIERSSTSCARTHFPIPSFSWVHRWVHHMSEFNIFPDLESANCLLNLAASLAVAFDCNGPEVVIGKRPVSSNQFISLIRIPKVTSFSLLGYLTFTNRARWYSSTFELEVEICLQKWVKSSPSVETHEYAPSRLAAPTSAQTPEYRSRAGDHKC